ncbi:MAG: lysophospholipid acyltransferase family protein [Polyangiales bacterium]
MARRVLGDDPFAPGGDEPPKPARTPAGGTKKAAAKPRRSEPPKPSKPPRASEAPKAPRRSKAPPKGAAAAAPEIPPAPPLPDLPPTDEAALDEVSQPPASVAEADGAPAALEPTPSLPPPAPAADVEDEIRDLEARLDQLLAAARDEHAQPMLDRMADRLRAAVAPAPEAPSERDDGAGDAARELLGGEFYRRQWGRVAMRDRTEEVDEFGHSPEHEARWRPVFDFLYDRWWRVEVTGMENVPATGRVALVANHSGAVPYDGIMLAAALRREHPSARQLRWLAEDFIFHLPFAGTLLTRLGAVRACQENAERLLRRDACVAMFPEGVKGIAKLFRDRYRLQRFGRGGHIKLAIRTRTPVVPVAIIGAEETHPLIAPSGAVGRLFGLPYFPVTPTFPLLGPLGALPLPSKWRIVLGEAIPMDGYEPSAADDEVLVGRLNEKLRATIQDMLERALRERRSVFGG